MPCFFYVTNSVYMEQKPETGKSTDKTKNTCYTSTIKANEKKIREETIMVIRLFCAAGMSTSLLVKKMEEAAKEKEALKQHIVFSYPQWKLVDYDSLADAADMIMNEKADCSIDDRHNKKRYGWLLWK